MRSAATRTSRSRLMRSAVAAALLGTGVAMTGCNNAFEGAASGAGLGALAGLGIGSLSGNAGEGAAIGAIVGGLAGGFIGDQNERNDQRAGNHW